MNMVKDKTYIFFILFILLFLMRLLKASISLYELTLLIAFSFILFIPNLLAKNLKK